MKPKASRSNKHLVVHAFAEKAKRAMKPKASRSNKHWDKKRWDRRSKSSKSYYLVSVDYPGSIDIVFDLKLERIVGKDRTTSAVWLRKPMTRDIDWEFRTVTAARKAAAKLRASRRKGMHVRVVGLFRLREVEVEKR